jgi:hypothetical protein
MGYVEMDLMGSSGGLKMDANFVILGKENLGVLQIIDG